jgi:hypothetical protein
LAWEKSPRRIAAYALAIRAAGFFPKSGESFGSSESDAFSSLINAHIESTMTWLSTGFRRAQPA